MLLAPTSMWAQASLSPRTAVALSNTNEQKAHHSKLKAQNSNLKTLYVTIDPARTSWQALGLTPVALHANTATVRLSTDALQQLAKQEGVELSLIHI